VILFVLHTGYLWHNKRKAADTYSGKVNVGLLLCNVVGMKPQKPAGSAQ